LTGSTDSSQKKVFRTFTSECRHSPILDIHGNPGPQYEAGFYI